MGSIMNSQEEEADEVVYQLPTPPKEWKAMPEMAVYCFDVIIGSLRNEKPCPFKLENINDDPVRFKKFPLFVTWKKDPHKRLRGCIGTFSKDITLEKGLAEYAKTSAFHDSRFQPITISEVPSLLVGVSLLIKFEKARDYKDWVVGKHGIRIEFKYNGRHYNAVFLPEVAVEQGWNTIDTIDHLMRKSGFEGPIYDETRAAIKVERFQSSKINMSYKDYCLIKKDRGQAILA